MGYLLNNNRQKIIEKASDGDFQDAINSRASVVEVPKISPLSIRGGISAADKQLAKRAYGDVTRNAPIYNDPRYTASTLAIPTDNRTLHGLFRFFAETDPIVGASLRIHSDLPLADLQLGQCEDSGVQSHYEEMWDKINGHRLLNDGVAEYYEIGDCVLPNTTVSTLEGFKKVKDIVESDFVLTGKGTYERVVAVRYRQAHELVYKLIPWNMNNIFEGCTGRHKIKTDRGYIKTTDLRVGDYLQLSLPSREVEDVNKIKLKSKVIIENSFKLNPKWLEMNRKFMGWLKAIEEPVIMSYEEVGIDVGGLNKVQINNLVTKFEKRGLTINRDRISIEGKESTQWNGIIWNGHTEKEIINTKTKRYFESKIHEVKITNQFMYLLGYWLGDGCLFIDEFMKHRYNMPYTHWDICFSHKYRYIAEKLVIIVKNVLGIDISISGGIYNQEDKGVGAPFHLSFKDPLFASWWSSQFGSNCNNKTIPNWVYNLPEEKIKYLVAGLIDSDGCVTVNGFTIQMANRDIISKIFQLGLHLNYEFLMEGINPFKEGNKIVFNGMVINIKAKADKYFRVAYSNRERAEDFLQYSLKDQTVFNPLKTSQSRQRLKKIDGDWYAELRKIKVKPYKGIVYDIQVENEPSFDADGLIVHNCFFFGAFNTTHYMWDQFAILNPDYVSIETTWVNQKPLIKLIPDEALKRIVQTQSPRFIYEQLPSEIIRYVLFNQEIPLDPNNVFHLAHAKRPYEGRGKSLIKRILKTLMLEDRFNQATFALATRHAVPLTIVKVGDQKSVEGDHFVTYKEGDSLKINTFEDLWGKYDGDIYSTGSPNEETKDISKHNLRTQSLDKNGKLTWNLIGGILRHPTPDKVVEITTPLSKIRTTESHGVMWINPMTLEYEKVKPFQLKERENPAIITYDKFDYSIKCNRYKRVELTEKFMYLFGLWTADGSMYRSPRYFGISNFDKEGIGRYLLSTYIDNTDVKGVREKVYPADTQYVFESKKIKKMLLELYGVKNLHKDNTKKEGQVPQEILFNFSNRLSGAFYAGLFDGDGFILKDGYLMCAMVTSSKEFAHWVALGLLSKEIMSRVVSRSGAYEVLITGNKNLLKYIKLIGNYVRHSKKLSIVIRYREELLVGRENNCKVYSYDLDESIISELFENSLKRVPGGGLPITYTKYCKRLSRESINKYGLDNKVKEVVNNLCSVAVTKITRVRKRTKFVYDLMLKDSPNTYIVGGDGWGLTANTGWVPSGEELDEVREMMSAYELDPNFCYDEDTECLTNKGWKGYTELTYEDKIACFNENTNGVEYHNPIYINIQDYEGDMYHFKSRTMDKRVTPNHRMFAKRDGKWQIILAKDIKSRDKFRTVIDNCETTTPLKSTITIAGKEVDTESFFKFIGWYLAEGSVSLNKKYNQYYSVIITQSSDKYCSDIEEILNKLPWKWSKYIGVNYCIYNKVLGRYMADNFGISSVTKKISRWAVEAQSEYLEGLIQSWLHGDGTYIIQKNGSIYSIGSSVSKDLVNSMQEIVFKCGYASRYYFYKIPYAVLPGETERRKVRKSDGKPFFDLYKLTVTKGKLMSFPGISMQEVIRTLPTVQVDLNNLPMKGKQIAWNNINLQNHLNMAGGVYSEVARTFKVATGTIIKQAKKQGVEIVRRFIEGKDVGSRHIKVEPYNGKIWCVTTPTGIIVTRRKGHIAIEGQSIIWHWGIDVQYYGSNGKMLPIGPELDRLYRLKFIGMGIHEQLITGVGGAYSQAYISLEIQRQRYLNLQLKLKQMVHSGWFKSVADMCGFYRINNATSMGGTVKSYKYGEVKDYRDEIRQQFSTLRDLQDNTDFRKFVEVKAEERKKYEQSQIRDYVYPELDFGGMSAATDENLKNYIKWLAKERPHLVDDATLARLGKLDRDKSEKSFVKDAERTQKRWKELSDKGLLDFIPNAKGSKGGGGVDLGGIPLPPTGGGGMEIGGEPNAPIGEGGPPEAATGEPPVNLTSINYDKEERLITEGIVQDDVALQAENKVLEKNKVHEKRAILRIINQ